MGIDLIPLKTYFGEEEYRDGIDLDHDDFMHYNFVKTFRLLSERMDCIKRI